MNVYILKVGKCLSKKLKIMDNKNINKKTSIENVIIVKDGKTTSIKKLETGNMRHGTEKK